MHAIHKTFKWCALLGYTIFCLAVVFPVNANNLSDTTERIFQITPVDYSDTFGLDTIRLPEVIVKADRDYTTIELGYYKKKFYKLVMCSYGLSCRKFPAMYVYIENRNNNTCFLKAIKIAINKKESGGRIRFRLKSIDVNGLPGKDIIDFRETFNTNISPIEFNIEHYNIAMPAEGVYLGIEILEESERGNLQIKDLSSTDSEDSESTLRVKATCNDYKTKVYIKSRGTEEWIVGEQNRIPRIGLIVKEFSY